MAKQKQQPNDSLIPKRPYWANCTAVGCGRGYTAKDRATAGHHCICGKSITWNCSISKDQPTFTSYKRVR